MTWELMWKIVLVGSLVAFAALATLVTILGAIDIRRLLRSLEAAEEQAKASEDESQS